MSKAKLGIHLPIEMSILSSCEINKSSNIRYKERFGEGLASKAGDHDGFFVLQFVFCIAVSLISFCT